MTRAAFVDFGLAHASSGFVISHHVRNHNVYILHAVIVSSLLMSEIDDCSTGSSVQQLPVSIVAHAFSPVGIDMGIQTIM